MVKLKMPGVDDFVDIDPNEVRSVEPCTQLISNVFGKYWAVSVEGTVADVYAQIYPHLPRLS